jgi:hypothetical protein
MSAALRSLLVSTLVAWAVTALLAAAWTLVAGGSFANRLATTAVGIGVLLFVTGGNVLSRASTLESSEWGIGVDRHRAEAKEDQGVGGLTGFGFALLIGGPLLLLGTVLLDAGT